MHQIRFAPSLKYTISSLWRSTFPAVMVSLVVGAVYCPLLLADVFQYQDGSGTTHYVDQLEKIPPEYRSAAAGRSKLPALSKIPSREYKTLPPVAIDARHQEVELFVTAWCGYCRKTEELLQRYRVKYKRYDIEQNIEGKLKHAQLGGGGVPVLKIGGEVVHGFKEQRIKELLKLK